MSEIESPKDSKGIISFLQNLISTLVGGVDPEREKKKLLRDLKKELKKYGKYYKGKDETVQPGLAQFFYDIYSTVGPAQMLLERYVESDVLKRDFVEHQMTDLEKKLVTQLSEESIRKRAQDTSLKQLKEQIKNELVQIYSFFDIEKVKNINALYMDFQNFYDLISFDFHFLLKKFDSQMPDNDFVYNPRFEAINAEYI
ncbi:MAG: hypothetical protein PF447_05950, partial [Spirochaetaceae bacterium]|nr:hypothetical protein [Spirochaetaceae bacterium]